MPLSEKIQQIRAGKDVRPPKKWWVGMRKIVRRNYPTFGARRINQITAGIWFDYSPQAQIGIIRRLQRGMDGVPRGYRR